MEARSCTAGGGVGWGAESDPPSPATHPSDLDARTLKGILFILTDNKIHGHCKKHKEEKNYPRSELAIYLDFWSFFKVCNIHLLTDTHSDTDTTGYWNSKNLLGGFWQIPSQIKFRKLSRGRNKSEEKGREGGRTERRKKKALTR